MKSADRTTARRRRTRAPILRAASYFFLALGLLALGYAGYVVVDAHAYQAYEQAKFEDVSDKKPPSLLVEGGVIGEIQVPRLHVKAIVVQGDSHTILRRAVGHIPETALPGAPGNVVLAGHRDTFFRPLRNIRLGDAITLKTPGGVFQYLVESTEVVPASDIEVLNASGGRTLTLITCFPFDYIGPAPSRYVVRARELVSPSPVPPPAP
ncbi:MAG TPA: class D sortase [Candidatus Acidoferrum sp.]|nr:class D sortase [Candidatus Acidoferrum sp.]